MTILASLVRAYDRLGDKAPAEGFSTERISFVIALNEDGTPAGKPIDLRDGEGRKRTSRLVAVPASFKRPGVTPRAFFLWDNTAYALGISADKDTVPRHKAFRDRHVLDLANTNDPGLVALRRFVETWRPEDFSRLAWPEEMKDQNVIFVLESDRRSDLWLHKRPAARALWSNLQAEHSGAETICLVTGERAPIAKLHPPIKGILPPGPSPLSPCRMSPPGYGRSQNQSPSSRSNFLTIWKLWLQSAIIPSSS